MFPVPYEQRVAHDDRMVPRLAVKRRKLRQLGVLVWQSADQRQFAFLGNHEQQILIRQQQELAVRAGAIAAGFLATPLISAVQRTLGLDILEIDATGERGQGPRITIAEQLAPGLVARFSRQFGPDPIDEATVEYSLSRLLRIRATFSDASSLSQRSPLRRIERAGIDLLLFFSF